MAFTANLVSRVPVTYATSIGRIITRWAGVEWELERIVYLLLGVTAKQGRLATRIPRAGDCVRLFVRLADLRGVTLNPKAMKALHDQLIEGVEWRDRIAHGVWLREPNNPRIFLQVTKGAWNDETGTSRKVMPEGMPLTLADLRKITRQIEEAGGRTHSLYRNLRHTLRSSPNRAALQPVGRISLGDNILTGPKRQPKA